MLVCALPQFASLATITHLETHREMSCRFGETRIFSTVTTSANCIYRLLLNHRAKMEISLTLFEKKGGGNRRGGKIAPLTPAPPPRFEGRSSFAKWRVPLLRPFVSVASFSGGGVGGSFRNWRLSSLHTLSPLQNNGCGTDGGNMNCEVHFWRASSSTADRIARYVIRPHSSFLPSFLFDPTKCPITNEASRFDSGVPPLGRSSFEIHL